MKYTVDYSDFRKGLVLITIPEISRFFEWVKKTDNCWLWTGYTDREGYARISIKGIQVLGHVLSYLLHNGAIPETLHVCHSCDNPKCVNPDHLWLGTHQDNIKDRDTKGRGVFSTRKGEDSNLSILKEVDIIEIRKCVAAGSKQKEMAKRFNVGVSNISSIINNRTWKQII